MAGERRASTVTTVGWIFVLLLACFVVIIARHLPFVSFGILSGFLIFCPSGSPVEKMTQHSDVSLIKFHWNRNEGSEDIILLTLVVCQTVCFKGTKPLSIKRTAWFYIYPSLRSAWKHGRLSRSLKAMNESVGLMTSPQVRRDIFYYKLVKAMIRLERSWRSRDWSEVGDRPIGEKLATARLERSWRPRDWREVGDRASGAKLATAPLERSWLSRDWSDVGDRTSGAVHWGCKRFWHTNIYFFPD
jgi:hypothetical protein